MQNTQSTQVATQEHAKSEFLKICSPKRLEAIVGKDNVAGFLSDFLILADQTKSNDFQDLAKCAIEIASMKLPIHKQAGQAYVVPRSGKLNIEIGYKGWLVLAKRAGYIVKTFPIYKGDKCEFKVAGFDEIFEYQPLKENQRAEKTTKFIEENLEFIAVCVKDIRSGEITNKLIETPLLGKLRSKAQSKDSPAYRDWLLEMYQAKAVKYVLRKLPIDTLDNSIFRAIAEDDKNDVAYSAPKPQDNKLSVVFSSDSQEAEVIPEV